MPATRTKASSSKQPAATANAGASDPLRQVANHPALKASKQKAPAVPKTRVNATQQWLNETQTPSIKQEPVGHDEHAAASSGPRRATRETASAPYVKEEPMESDEHASSSPAALIKEEPAESDGHAASSSRVREETTPSEAVPRTQVQILGALLDGHNAILNELAGLRSSAQDLAPTAEETNNSVANIDSNIADVQTAVEALSDNMSGNSKIIHDNTNDILEVVNEISENCVRQQTADDIIDKIDNLSAEAEENHGTQQRRLHAIVESVGSIHGRLGNMERRMDQVFDMLYAMTPAALLPPRR